MAIHYDENLYKTWTMSPPLVGRALFNDVLKIELFIVLSCINKPINTSTRLHLAGIQSDSGIFLLEFDQICLNQRVLCDFEADMPAWRRQKVLFSRFDRHS